MTGLVDHYLLQLRSFLPARQREDIAAELGDSIRAAVAERERTLGRVLTEDEVASVLKGYGHPLVVAGRYLPKQELIGARLFPIYWYALQAVVIVITVIAGILIGIAVLTEPRPMQSALQVLMDFFWLTLCAAAIVTLVFAVLDHEPVRLKFLEEFEPRKLDAGIFKVRSAPLSPIARSDTVFEIATEAVFLGWWVGWLDFNYMLGVDAALELTAAIEPFFWPVLALCAIDLARLAADFVYPYRTRPRVLARLAINVGWLVFFVLVFRNDGLIEATAADAAVGERALQIGEWILRGVVGVLALVTAGLIATDVVRLVRR